MDSFEFAPGYRFDPTDAELFIFYLKPKVIGQELPLNCIQDKEIYGPNSSPWDVFDHNSTPWIVLKKNPNEKITYVFTPLTKIKAEEGIGNYVKKAGCGTWHGDTPRVQITDEKGNVLGTRRLLNFHINDITNVDLGKVGKWKMHEYVLCGYENYALCRITLDTSKSAKIVLVSKTVRSTKSKAKTSAKDKSTKSKAKTSAKDKSERVASQFAEEAMQISMNNNEDSLGTEFSSGCNDVPSLDFEDLSWSQIAEYAHSMESCRKVLGKRKSFESQEHWSGVTKKLCM